MQAELLDRHILGYSGALECGFNAEEDYLGELFQEYSYVIPWRLKDHEEPLCPLPLYNWNMVLVSEILSLEEAVAKKEAVVYTQGVHNFFFFFGIIEPRIDECT